MARTTTYLNFTGETAAAFTFYRCVFGTEFIGPIQRMSDVPVEPGMPQLSDAERSLVLHAELPILGGHILMGSDLPESAGHTITYGTNVSINLELDTREEAQRLFTALGEGGKVTMELQDMFWGGYFGSLRDRFGVNWMVHHMPAESPSG